MSADRCASGEARQAPASLTVVLVSYNTEALLIRTLERIAAAPWIVPIVVDNASADGSAAAVAARFPAIALVSNRDNVGFARAANQGIARARTPYVALVNPDTDVSPRLLQEVVDHLAAHPEVWAVAPRLVRPGGGVQTMDAGFAPTPLRAVLYYLGISYLLPWPAAGFCVPPGIHRPLEVDWLSGACLTFRREIVERIGAFDESFFLYGEDLDWCRRMRAAGGHLVLLGDQTLTHAQGASSGHEVVSVEWLSGLARYVRPLTSPMGARIFFAAAAAGFWLRGLRSMLPGSSKRRSTLFGYAHAAVRLAGQNGRAASAPSR